MNARPSIPQLPALFFLPMPLTHARTRIACLCLAAGIPVFGIVLRAAVAEEKAAISAADLEFFEKRIRPLLVANCYECHSAKSKTLQGGLKLDSAPALAEGGDSGAVIVRGEPDKSPLIDAVRYENDQLQMPPTGKLAAEAIADLVEWARRGAPYPATGGASTERRVIDLAKGREHWAFQPLHRSNPPAISTAKTTEWPRERIDGFILAAQEARELQPSPPASRQTWIRRLKFDLLGLPPTPEEIDEFVADASADAEARLVDRYLASLRYGERWGRFWLDLARYCDVPESWREGNAKAWIYRDWVVRSLNADMPYDEFARRQLAADLLPDFQPADAAALGFLGLSPTYWKELKLDHVVIKQVVAEEWEERIEAISGTFLGLTLACARCHDHKFDPITTQDYYALAGVVASIRLEDRPIIAPDLAKAAQAGRDRVKELEKERDKLKKEQPTDEEAKRFVVELDDQIAEIRRTTPHYDTPLAYGVSEASLSVLPDGPHKTKLEYMAGLAQDVEVQIRGNPARLGAKVPRRFVSVLSKENPGEFRAGSGRLELADAIVSDAAPLAARVIVNRVWRHHFGRGIVGTPSNFGTQGERPTHPELLEDLAARFIEEGWSLKRLHREIVLSAAYRQASTRRESDLAIDPENVYLWRMSVQRLDVEAWRDALLSATGELEGEIGGEPRDLADVNNRRRTLYGIVKRRELADILRLNDFPDPVAHSGARQPTTSPLQQLYVLNSPFMQRRAEALVARLKREAGEEPERRIHLAHRLLFSRDVTADELAWGQEYVAAAGSETTALDRAWKQYAQALLAGNELMFAD